MTNCATAYIALGSNLGDREENLRVAIEKIGESPGITVTKVSAIIESEPEGGADEPKYLNAAAKIETTVSPRALLDELERIEREMGRKGKGKRLPRRIDLDIVLFDDLVIDEPGLRIPHPRMHEREFVLQPLKEIAPEAFHPLLNKPIAAL